MQNILARGQEVARTVLHPLQAGTLSSSPCQPRQASTTSQTDLERNTPVLLILHTLPPPSECGLGPHSGSQSASRYLLLSQSHSENTHLPQRGRPPALRGSGSRGTGHCIISHLPSEESNETTMGTIVLCEGQGRTLGYEPRLGVTRGFCRLQIETESTLNPPGSWSWKDTWSGFG